MRSAFMVVVVGAREWEMHDRSDGTGYNSSTKGRHRLGSGVIRDYVSPSSTVIRSSSTLPVHSRLQQHYSTPTWTHPLLPDK